jgi:hypothetical protein
VGAELLIRPAGGKDGSPAACPTRLRGVFLPGGKPGRELLAYEGGGRLVGLVCQQEEDAEPGVASLSVDGRPVEGWAAPDLSLLVGQSGQFRSCLSGRQGGLCWRYLLLAPVEFRKSIALEATADGLGPRLALFYTK